MSVEMCQLSIGQYVGRCVDRCPTDMSVNIAADIRAIHWPLIIGGISVECRWSISRLSYNISQKFRLSCSVRCIIATSTQVAVRYRRSFGSLSINMSTDTWPIYRLRCVGQGMGRVSVEISADMSTHTSRSTHQPRVGQSICQLTYRLRGAQTTHDPSFVGCVCFFFFPSVVFNFIFLSFQTWLKSTIEIRSCISIQRFHIKYFREVSLQC